jgi:hypothetical protein
VGPTWLGGGQVGWGFGRYWPPPAAGGGALRDGWGQGEVGPACSWVQLRRGACAEEDIFPAVGAAEKARGTVRTCGSRREGAWLGQQRR